jgi:hypothetical protein
MKKVFKLTNQYIVLGTPLILFTLIASVYLAVATRGTTLNVIIALGLFSLMWGAFIAGWFYMIKQTINQANENDPNSLLKEFTVGVGEYFLPSLGAIAIMTLVSIAILILSILIGTKLIGSPNISATVFSDALSRPMALKLFLNSLSPEQTNQILEWNLLLMLCISITYFLGMLYIPAIFYNSKNPFIAYFISLKNLFSKMFLKSLGIFLLIFITYFVLSILTTIFVNLTVVHFILTLAHFYFETIVAVGLFYYYKTSFVK